MLDQFLLILRLWCPFQVSNVSSIAIITVSLNSNLIITRQGTPVSPISPATFLFGTNWLLFWRDAQETHMFSLFSFIEMLKSLFNKKNLNLSFWHTVKFYMWVNIIDTWFFFF